MYPSRELNRLAERRAIIQARIELRRRDCIVAVRDLRESVERAKAWGRVLRAFTLAATIGSGIKRLFRSKPPASPADGRKGRSAAGKILAWAPAALKAIRLAASFV